MNDLYIRGLKIDWDDIDKYSYLHGISSIRSISELTLDKNITFFVGENGSGKTTLLKTLLGLKTPAAGSVVFQNGFQLRDIGYLPQQSDIQRDFPASVFEIVLSGFVNEQHKLRYTPAQKKAAQIICTALNIF